MNVALGLAMFGCWAVAYFLITIRGSRRRPMVSPRRASSSNLTWELTLGFVRPPPDHRIQLISMGWAALDLVILVQFCIYRKRDFPTGDEIPQNCLFLTDVARPRYQQNQSLRWLSAQACCIYVALKNYKQFQ